MTERHMRVLPDPVSPTRPTTSPGTDRESGIPHPGESALTGIELDAQSVDAQ